MPFTSIGTHDAQWKFRVLRRVDCGCCATTGWRLEVGGDDAVEGLEG
jgi:hypothetical protein